MLKIIHAADLHLDSTFGALSAEKARERRREGRFLVERLTELARRERVDALLLSGDLFDGREVYPETLECLRESFAALEAKVFIAPGNHDPYRGGGAYERVKWSDNVYIFRSEAIEAVEWAEKNAVIYGAAFTAGERNDRPLANFTAPQDGRLHVMVLHGDMSGGGSAYGAIHRDEIAASGLDYLALGHIHQRIDPRKAEKTYWAYPGCPEGRGFDELGEKGVLMGEIGKGSVELCFVPLARRRYEILAVDVTDRDAEEAVRQALPPSAIMDIIRVRLVGETDEKGLNLYRLQERLAGLCYALELRDETTVRIDLAETAGEDTLRGLFLRRMREKISAAETEEERKIAEDAMRMGLAALSGREL